jgi:hypothetical protein
MAEPNPTILVTMIEAADGHTIKRLNGHLVDYNRPGATVVEIDNQQYTLFHVTDKLSVNAFDQRIWQVVRVFRTA